jgi:hypothetical protein
MLWSCGGHDAVHPPPLPTSCARFRGEARCGVRHGAVRHSATRTHSPPPSPPHHHCRHAVPHLRDGQLAAGVGHLGACRIRHRQRLPQRRLLLHDAALGGELLLLQPLQLRQQVAVQLHLHRQLLARLRQLRRQVRRQRRQRAGHHAAAAAAAGRCAEAREQATAQLAHSATGPAAGPEAIVGRGRLRRGTRRARVGTQSRRGVDSRPFAGSGRRDTPGEARAASATRQADPQRAQKGKPCIPRYRAASTPQSATHAPEVRRKTTHHSNERVERDFAIEDVFAPVSGRKRTQTRNGGACTAPIAATALARRVFAHPRPSRALCRGALAARVTGTV